MKLRAIDQIHISAVKSDTLRPGEEFEVSNAAGAALLRAHPGRLKQVGAAEPGGAIEAAKPARRKRAASEEKRP